MVYEEDYHSIPRRAVVASKFLKEIGTLNIPGKSIVFWEEIIPSVPGLAEKLYEQCLEFSRITGMSFSAAREKLMEERFMDARWASFAMPVYEVTHSLAAVLMLTDVRNEPLAEVMMPFPIFVVKLPNSIGLNGGRGIGEVKSVWIHRYEHSSGKTVVTMMSNGVGPQTTVSNALGETTTTTWVGREVKPEDGHLAADPTASKVDAPDVLRILKRLILNLCSWVTSGAGGVERNGRWKKSGPSDGPGDGVPSTWIIGKEVKVGREILSSAKSMAESESGLDVKTWKLVRRHVVAGHRRLQPCGPGRKETKEIFIQPYWKGPKDSAEAWTRTYKAQ